MPEPTELASLFLRNFDLAMLLTAVIFIVLHRYVDEKAKEGDMVFAWVSLFGLGMTSLYAFIIHFWFPALAAVTIGYSPSPYHTQVGFLNLIFALFAFAAFNADFGYRMAIAICSAFLLWTDVGAHIYEMVYTAQFTLGNAGSWLFTDFAIPLILLLCLPKLKLK
nr:Unknown Function [uncultured bacterium]